MGVSFTRDPHSKPPIQVLTVYPSPETLNTSPQYKFSIQVLTMYPSPQTLTPMHHYVSFTRDPYYVSLFTYPTHIHNTQFLLLSTPPPPPPHDNLL